MNWKGNVSQNLWTGWKRLLVILVPSLTLTLADYTAYKNARHRSIILWKLYILTNMDFHELTVPFLLKWELTQKKNPYGDYLKCLTEARSPKWEKSVAWKIINKMPHYFVFSAVLTNAMWLFPEPGWSYRTLCMSGTGAAQLKCCLEPVSCCGAQI